MAIKITMARTGDDPKVLTLPEGTTMEIALRTGSMELKGGEVATREGAVVKADEVVKEGDIIFIENNDDNGSN